MSTLIFDIETVGEDFESLDEVTKKTLLRYAIRAAKDKTEREALVKDIKEGLGFSPLTGFIVALGLYDLEREKGVVYYTSPGGEIEDIHEDTFTYKARSEGDLLREFWIGAEHYDTFVTFNGRRFDAPFLFHRSAVYDITPTKNLLEGRYPYQQKNVRHVDLQDELTFFGAMDRRPGLHLFCRAYGIDTPKAEFGGDDVAELYHQGEYLKIAKYNAKDVLATAGLYQKWLKITALTKELTID